MIALTILCAVACAVLVVAEWKRLALVRIVAKTIAALAFLGVGLLASRGAPAYAAWIVGGLALGVVGDIALLGRSNRAFMIGLGAFLLGHLAYVVAIAQVVPPQDWLVRAGLPALLPVAVAGGALVLLWPHLGRMRVPVILYVLAIVLMVIGALALGSQRLALGAILFFVSDLAVAREKFLVQSFSNRAFGLPAYFAAQLLIAWSL